MGAGIAEAARDAGVPVLLHDPDPAARGRVEGVEWAPALADLAPCDVVIEAAPEALEVKRALFTALAEVVAPDAVLATNTSSLLVSAIAAGVPGPERVVGLHFFNPVRKMRLVELVAGADSSPGRARPRAGARRGDGQARDRRRRRAGLPRQPLQPAVLARGAADRAGAARHARAGRPDLPPRRGLPHGPVRADGPRRDRRRVRDRALVLRADATSRAGARRRSRRGWRRAAGTAASPAAAGTRTRRAGRPTPSRRSPAAATGSSWSPGESQLAEHLAARRRRPPAGRRRRRSRPRASCRS